MTDLKKYIEKILIDEKQILNRCKELGEEITNDYNGEIVVIGILKGAVPFMSELIKRIDRPMKLDYMAVSSYEGSTSSGEVRILKDLDFRVENKDVLIVEDIIDTGLTISYLIEVFKNRGAKSVNVCALLSKPSRRKVNIDSKYIGFEIDDYFVVGWGMDFNEDGRSFPYIAAIDKNIL